ncbi:MAG TPA: DUF2147 domain-containing protein [Vicinamibacterales bacterium]|nr:DUF2147 domain-containing protein [Vicinamibacterales bacterium]
MLRTATRVHLVLVATLLCRAASAQQLTPEGRWRTIDDKTNVAKSIVAITLVNGQLEGTVERVFVPPSKEEFPMCTPCPGEFNGKPVIGMRILWGLRRDGSAQEYVDGRVFDPDAGKIYRCKVRVVDGGRKLEVRGFVGVSLLGRTQTWVREAGATR